MMHLLNQIKVNYLNGLLLWKQYAPPDMSFPHNKQRFFKLLFSFTKQETTGNNMSQYPSVTVQ